MKYFILSLSFLVLSFSLFAQKQNYRASIVGFYNLENFFDTVNNPKINDEEFLPNSPRQYNGRIYFDKVNRLATVISQLGTDINPDGIAFMGVAEVENDTVLTDLVNSKLLKDRNLKIVHYDSPDARGIDVGFLYNPKYFSVISSAPLFVKLPSGSKDAYYTRDVLYVKGVLDGDTINVFVNHWPSRSGGEERSAPGRAAAAGVVKQSVDSLMAINQNSKILIMGDLNDDPISPSITKVLKAKGKTNEVEVGGLYNPWVDFYKKGIGTSPYQDAWGLFDQIMMSQAFLPRDQSGYFYLGAHIFNKPFLVEKLGKYRNYSKRTWSGITYNYGYSDHFAVFITLLKKVD